MWWNVLDTCRIYKVIVFVYQSCTRYSRHEPSLAATIGLQASSGTGVRACEELNRLVCATHHEPANTLRCSQLGKYFKSTHIGRRDWPGDWFWGTPACFTLSAQLLGENLHYTVGMILYLGYLIDQYYPSGSDWVRHTTSRTPWECGKLSSIYHLSTQWRWNYGERYLQLYYTRGWYDQWWEDAWGEETQMSGRGPFYSSPDGQQRLWGSGTWSEKLLGGNTFKGWVRVEGRRRPNNRSLHTWLCGYTWRHLNCF